MPPERREAAWTGLLARCATDVSPERRAAMGDWALLWVCGKEGEGLSDGGCVFADEGRWEIN